MCEKHYKLGKKSQLLHSAHNVSISIHQDIVDKPYFIKEKINTGGLRILERFLDNFSFNILFSCRPVRTRERWYEVKSFYSGLSSSVQSGQVTSVTICLIFLLTSRKSRQRCTGGIVWSGLNKREPWIDMLSSHLVPTQVQLWHCV